MQTVAPATRGRITVSPHGNDLTPEQLKKLETELNATRPAGVQLILTTPLTPVRVDLTLRLTTAAKTVEADLRAAHNQVREAIRELHRPTNRFLVEARLESRVGFVGMESRET